MKTLRRGYRLLLLCVQTLFALYVILIAIGPNPERRNVRDWYWINLWMRVACQIFGLRLQIHGQAYAGPVLYVANHTSWQDIIVLQSLLQSSFVSKYEVLRWPLIGWMAYRGSTLFIRRGKHDAFHTIKQAMLTRLQHGQNIIFFPEGTTGDGHKVLRFKARLFEPAIQAGCKVQAVALAYRNPALKKEQLAFIGEESFASHLWRMLGEKYTDISVHFCEALDTAAQTAKSLAEQAQQQVELALLRN